MKREALVQLTNGDAIQGVTSHLAFWWRYLRVQNAKGLDGRSGKASEMAGDVLIPKRKVMFVQVVTLATVLNEPESRQDVENEG